MTVFLRDQGEKALTSLDTTLIPLIVAIPGNVHKVRNVIMKHNYKNFEQAMKRAQEFDYNKPTNKTKIPLGIFYKGKRKTFEENFK